MEPPEHVAIWFELRRGWDVYLPNDGPFVGSIPGRVVECIGFDAEKPSLRNQEDKPAAPLYYSPPRYPFPGNRTVDVPLISEWFAPFGWLSRR